MPIRTNIPPVTRILLLVLIGLSFLYNLARWKLLDGISQTDHSSPATVRVPYLTLVPDVCLYYPWTFATTTFVERNIFTLLISGATLFYGGKYLERAWGSKEFGLFVILVAVAPNMIVAPIYMLWTGIMASGSKAETIICGGISLQAAFLVALKQLVPEHTVTILKGVIKMRMKHFPALFLLLNSIAGVILGTSTAAFLAWLGFLIGWIYLRFYKLQPDLSTTSTGGPGLRGDASETFAFASFFPDVMQPPIAVVGDQIYLLLVAVRLCTPFSAEAVASGNEQAAARSESGLPSLLNGGGRSNRGMGKREEAERRRALALKALDQRLNAATASKAQQPAAPVVQQGQSMLGETSYDPDHEARGEDRV